MTRDETIRELSTIVASVLPPGSPAPSSEDSLQERGLDSVGMVSLLAALEERFDISLPPEEIREANFSSISTLANLVLRLRSKGP
jgi:acyl carrier protein